MLEKKDLVTLDDNNKYCIVSKITTEKVIFYYLIDVDNNLNIKICFEKKHNNQIKLVEIQDKELIQALIPLLFNAM